MRFDSGPQQESIVAAQDNYCMQQRKNEHTLRAIKNLLGDELAEEFVTTVLFPTAADIDKQGILPWHG